MKRVGPLTEEFIEKKLKKPYLMNPFLYRYRFFSRWVLTQPPDPAKLVEECVASHPPRTRVVGYWEKSSQIDSLVETEKGLVGLEIQGKCGASAIKL